MRITLKELTLIRFEGLELDPAARTLKRDGQPIALSPKTFDLLVYLTGNAQQVLSKEQVLAAVWPNSFVEESNLSQHIFLLRKALAGIGLTERIVVTVPGRGYQFTAAVEFGKPGALPATSSNALVMNATSSVTHVTVEEEYEDESAAAKTLPASGSRRRWRFWAIGAAAFLVAAAGALGLWRWLRPSPQAHVDLVMSGIENMTGETDFDQVLNQALQIDLEQSPYLNLLSRSIVQETLALMQKPATEHLSPELAREVCERSNAQVTLHGTLSKLGGKYLLMLSADSCVTGKTVAGYKAEASSKEDVLTALDRAAGQVRRKLGESRASLERFEIPIASVTTPSLEALRAYSQAQGTFNRGDMEGAIAPVQRAIQLDPKFGAAYRLQASMYYNLGDLGKAADTIQMAYDLRDRTNERERLNTEIAYHYFGDFDMEAAARSLNLYLDIYPNDAGNWGNLCNLYTQLGQYTEAIRACEAGVRRDPHSGFLAEVYSRALKRANRFEEAKAVASKSVAEGHDRWGTHSILYQVAYAEKDAAGVKRETDWGLAHSQKAMTYSNLGFAAATGGKREEAESDFTHAEEESRRNGDQDYAEGMIGELAYVEIQLGQPDRARELLKQVPDAPQDPTGVMVEKAELGDFAEAQRYLASIHPETDRATIQVFRDLPILRATVALASHKAAEAIRMLEPSRPYQLADFQVPYLRATAEAEAGLPDAAAADYRLILANQGVDPISPLYSLAHLRLAEVLAKQGQTEKAEQEFEAFLEAWRAASDEEPLKKRAIHELQSLKSTPGVVNSVSK